MPRLVPRQAAEAAFGDVPEDGPTEGGHPQGLDFKTYPKARERDPYRRLGLTKEVSFEEVQHARNYLVEQYKWHETSREAIELAYEDILQQHLKSREKFGFRPPRTGRRSDLVGDEQRVSLRKRLWSLVDPTVTSRTLVNEGAVFGAFAAWTLFSSDQSFPLAAAIAYSIYAFQLKRAKRNPDGPFFGGNVMIGAVFGTFANLAIACGVMALVTNPLAALVGGSARQVGACLMVVVLGTLNVYLK